MKEITFELTNYCPHNCAYCSSDATDKRDEATYLDFDHIAVELFGTRYDRIILSGGEPLSHPLFYDILQLCKKHTDDVVIYSNAITHTIYNHNVIDGVYLEANMTVLPEVDKVHVLRRVKQGKEKNRPEVHLSRNFSEDCECDHIVVRPDGNYGTQPCNKWHYQET